MESNGHRHKRQVILEAATEEGLRESLQKIPGVAFRVATPHEAPLQEKNVYILSIDGQDVYMRHEPGAKDAKSSNILPQDSASSPTPFGDDASMKLAKLARSVDGLSVYPVISDDELDRGKLRD